MAYVISKHPLIRLDLMVRKEFWPKLVSDIRRCECAYEEEKEVKIGDGNEWVYIRDVHSLRGYELGALIGLFYSMEWAPLNESGKEEKFYLTLNLRKKEKKDGIEDRKEADAGRKGGNTGKSAGDIRFGPNSRNDGNADQSGPAGIDDLGRLPVLEGSDDDCQ